MQKNEETEVPGNDALFDQLLPVVENDLRSLFGETQGTRVFGRNTSPNLAQTLEECATAHLYPLEAGGKRVRPLLMLSMAHALGGQPALERARPSACAIELVHTYSLVHDDLPCMDNDDLRRGKPTAHKVYGDSKALLIGDGLLAMAFQVISSRGQIPPWTKKLTNGDEALQAVQILAQAAGPQGMVAGQWMDIAKATVLPEDLLALHHLKTGKLLGAALAMGALHGLSTLSLSWECTLKITKLAQESGELIGIAFQLIDDVLDAESHTTVLGKSQGKDAAQGKVTAIGLFGAPEARRLASEYSAQAQEILSSAIVTAHMLSQKEPPTIVDIQHLPVMQMVERLTTRAF